MSSGQQVRHRRGIPEVSGAPGMPPDPRPPEVPGGPGPPGVVAGAGLFAGPPVDVAPEVGVREVFRRFWPYTRPYRRWLALGLVFVVLTPVLDTGAIWLFKILIDEVLTPRDFGPFPWIAAAYIGFTVVMGATSFGDRYLSVWVGERFLTDLRITLYRHLHGLSLDFFERRRLGDILSRLTGDIAAIEGLVLSGVTRAISYLLRILLFGGMLFYLQWQLAMLSLLVAPLFWAVSRAFSRRLKAASRENRRNAGAMSAIAEESLANVALVQAHNRQDDEIERFHQQNLASQRSQLHSTRLRGMFSPITDLLELLGLLLVIGFGTYQLTRGRMTLGELLVFMAYFGQLYRPLRGIGRLATSLSSASAGAERILEVLALRPSVTEPVEPFRPGAVVGEVRFSDVRFRYPGSTAESLRGVSLRVRPGETLALVGDSGAGKSTAGKLLLRFYDVTDGAIRIDGHDLRTWQLRTLREHVAVVMQETLVFDGSIRDNVMWARPEAGEEEFLAAARAADLDGVARTLPEGYDTRVGQRGRRLSGGQRQRVAIARAMLRDAPILLLDEPTTGLDAATADRILVPLRRLIRGRTTIIISHDLRAVSGADRIVVLEGGAAVAEGSWQELLASGDAARFLPPGSMPGSVPGSMPGWPEEWAASSGAGSVGGPAAGSSARPPFFRGALPWPRLSGVPAAPDWPAWSAWPGEQPPGRRSSSP